MKSVGLNLLIATIWLLLSQKPSSAVFVAGYLIGFALVAAFRRVLGDDGYVRRCLALLRFLVIFCREFVMANAKVAWVVLFRSKHSLEPDFITYDVGGLTRMEILVLSYCISLTPGTTTVDISPDFRTLILHALDASRPDAVRAGIDRILKRNVLSFTR